MRTLAAAVVLALASVASLAAEPVPIGAAAPAGAAVARDLASAWNAGTDDALRSFESTWRAPAAAGRRPLEERVASWRKLRDDFGALDVRSVDGDERSGRLVARAGKDGSWLTMDFVLVGGPAKLDGVRIAISPEQPPEHADALDDAARNAALAKLADTIEARYVFPKDGARLAAMVREGIASGRWSAVTTTEQFAERLTEDLRAVVNDRHLGVRPAPAGAADAPASAHPLHAPGDHGFIETKLLEGGVGYVRLDLFDEGPAALEVAAREMAKVQDATALVFDLRHNGGGSPQMISFLAGYLYEKPTLLNTFVGRDGKRESEVTSTANVPGHRFGVKLPVYVLTSKRTFSAAEEFAYDLQMTRRATLVGEATGGGAHPVGAFPIGARLSVSVPILRALNPYSNKDWEGTGVVPDVPVPADRALDEALALIAKRRG